MGIRGGVEFTLLDPKPEHFHLEHTARTLSYTRRFASNYGDYTVAQHSVLVARAVREAGGTWREQLSGLHHDDTEAVTGDLPRPVKDVAAGFRDLEATLQRASDARWGLDSNGPLVRAADYKVFYSEVQRLVPPEHRWIYADDTKDVPSGELVKWVDMVPWGSDRAFAEYMDMHEFLIDGLRKYGK